MRTTPLRIVTPGPRTTSIKRPTPAKPVVRPIDLRSPVPIKRAPIVYPKRPVIIKPKPVRSSSSSGGGRPKSSATVKPTSVKLNSLGASLDRRDLKEHQIVNNAVQKELKTKQELAKAQGLKEKVKQEALKNEGIAEKVDQEKYKTEKLKAQTQMISTGKGLIWLGVLVGGYFFVTKVLMKDKLLAKNKKLSTKGAKKLSAASA